MASFLRQATKMGSVENERFDGLVTQLSAPDPDTRRAAREVILSAAIDHMRVVAHRMVRGFPQVRRWDETDDIVQNASIRLARALDNVGPADGRHLLGLIALQVRRELVDLARRYRGVESFAHYHESNSCDKGEINHLHDGDPADPAGNDHDALNAWTRFHETAATLDDEDRELFNLVWYLGLNQEQAANALDCSVRTVARRWEVLKRRLVAEFKGQAPT